MWYVTIELCRVSVLCIRVHDLGGAEWSCRRCTGPTFGRVLISSTSCGHLTLVVTPQDLPPSAGVSGCSVHPWAYK